MKRFFLTLIIAFLIFFGFMWLASAATAGPRSKNPFKKEGPIVQLDAPPEYTGHYTLKGEFGPNDVLSDGTQVNAPTCYDPGLNYKSNFTLENVKGVATINEVELKNDSLFSFTRLEDGSIKIGHTMLVRGNMLMLRFLTLKKKGNKITATGYLIKVDGKSGDIYCGNNLKMRGSIKRY